MQNQMLLQAYLKRLKLPAVLGNYQEIARQTAQANQPYESYLLALVELEVQHRDENAHKRRVRLARFPMIKTLDQFDFTAVPSLSKAQVLNLAQGEYIQKKENLILMGNSGTGKTHLAIALGLLACQQGHKSRFFTAAGLINHLVESQAQLKLSQVERALEKVDLVIIDEVGYVPFSEAGAQLFFQLIANSYERQSLILTTNLDLSQWTQVFGSQQLTGALLDRLTHHAHILTMNGESYRFKESMKKKGKTRKAQ
jgi:DNA replication protein DnaC